MPLHGYRLKGPDGTFGTMEEPLTKAEIESLFLEGRIDTDWLLSHTLLPRYWVPVTRLTLPERNQSIERTGAVEKGPTELAADNILATGDRVRGGPKGLNGWLLLIGIALWATFLIKLKLGYETLSPFIEDFDWALVRDFPPDMHPIGRTALLVAAALEIAVQAISIGLLVGAVFLYHIKHCYFPPVFILVTVFNSGGLLFQQFGIGLGIAIPISILCILYTLCSVRVKNTFLLNC